MSEHDERVSRQIHFVAKITSLLIVIGGMILLILTGHIEIQIITILFAIWILEMTR